MCKVRSIHVENIIDSQIYDFEIDENANIKPIVSRAKCVVNIEIRQGRKVLIIRSPLQLENKTKAQLLIELNISQSSTAIGFPLRTRIIWSDRLDSNSIIAVPAHLTTLHRAQMFVRLQLTFY